MLGFVRGKAFFPSSSTINMCKEFLSWSCIHGKTLFLYTVIYVVEPGLFTLGHLIPVQVIIFLVSLIFLANGGFMQMLNTYKVIYYANNIYWYFEYWWLGSYINISGLNMPPL